MEPTRADLPSANTLPRQHKEQSMAKIVLGIATSHSPMLALNADQWRRYAIGDLTHTGLVYPPNGISMTYDEGLAYVSEETRTRDI